MLRRPPRSTRTTHSFPTRRSSDLLRLRRTSSDLQCWPDASHCRACKFRREACVEHSASLNGKPRTIEQDGFRDAVACFSGTARYLRSEEHTSELQSLMRISYAVFCLKTKNKKNKKQTTIYN